MKNTMNLYKKYKKDSVKQRQMSKTGALIGISIAILLIMSAVGIRFTIEKYLIQSDIDKLQAYINHPTNVENYNNSKQLSDDAKQLETFKTVLGELEEVFVNKDSVSSDIFISIYDAKPSDLTISQMGISGPIVNISYKSKDASASSRFVSALKESNRVKEVKYDGYEKDASTEFYSGTVTLTLRGNF